MGIPDYEGRPKRLPCRIEFKENGITRQVVILHVAGRTPFQREPVVLMVKEARIASDDHVVLDQTHMRHRKPVIQAVEIPRIARNDHILLGDAHVFIGFGK